MSRHLHGGTFFRSWEPGDLQLVDTTKRLIEAQVPVAGYRVGRVRTARQGARSGYSGEDCIAFRFTGSEIYRTLPLCFRRSLLINTLAALVVTDPRFSIIPAAAVTDPRLEGGI